MGADHTEHPVHPDLSVDQLAVMNLAQWRAALRSSLGSPVEPGDRRSA
jgi:hypothetical protein